MKVKNIIWLILSFFAVLFINNTVEAASFDSSISKTTVTVGDTFTVTVKANSAAGTYKVTTSNSNVSVVSGLLTDFLDNSSATITFKANAVGSVSIGAYALDMTDNDDDTIPVTGGRTFNVTVSAIPTPTPTPTPTPAPTFSSVSETVYTTSQVTFRSSYSTSSSSLGTIPEGATLTRIGVSSTKVGGYYWSKVTYNGKTGYVASTFLTTTKPEEKPSPTPEPEEKKSNDSTLKSLSITGVEFTPAFSSSVLTYVATIGEDVSEVEIKAEVNNEKAKYEVVGNKDLQNGENKVVVTVTAEDGTVTNYEIKLIKGKEEVPLDAFKIIGIKENDEKVDILLSNPEITEDFVEYTINLNEYLKSIDIQEVLSDDINEYEGTGLFDLVVGENKFTILLKQKGENEEIKTIEYRITINNPEKTVVQPAAEEQNGNSKINIKLVIAIAAVVIITIAGITFAVLYYKKQNALKYAKPDYSFLREDEEVQSKEQKRAEELEKNDVSEKAVEETEKITDEAIDETTDENKRKGGKHF